MVQAWVNGWPQREQTTSPSAATAPRAAAARAAGAGVTAFANETAYEIGEQPILNVRGSNRVIWRAVGAARPPLYPVGVTDLAAREQGS